MSSWGCQWTRSWVRIPRRMRIYIYNIFTLYRMEAQFVKLGLPVDTQLGPDPEEDGIDDVASSNPR